MSNYFSYMRISTKEASDKQSFNRQEKSLKAYAENSKIEYTLSFKDDCTGSTFDVLNGNVQNYLILKIVQVVNAFILKMVNVISVIVF